MDILTQIMAERRADVAAARERVPEDTLLEATAGIRHHRLAERLRSGYGTAIIAEMKKASPSAGLLREAYWPPEIAEAYAVAGAAAVSVLTEGRHFLGSGEDLMAVRETVNLPILRKDFICDAYQVIETAAWGGDILLLIVAALEPPLLRDLYAAAVAMELEVLVEAHDEDELEAALALPEAIVGVNSRNLKTLKTDLSVAHRLAAAIPADRLSIAESGISRRDQIVGLEEAGYSGFLIGESLLACESPGAKLRELRGVA